MKMERWMGRVGGLCQIEGAEELSYCSIEN